MKLSLLAGSTSQTINLFIRDSSSTVGAGLTGLAFGTSGLTAYYMLPRAAPVAITLATQTVTGAYSSGGFVELSSSNAPGWYRLDLPDAAIASGRFSSLHLKGATNMAALPIELELTAWNNQDGVHGGLSALPNTACTTNASLLTSGTGTDQVSVSSGKTLLQATQTGVTIPTVTTVTNQLTGAAVATAIWQDTTAGDFTVASSIGKGLFTSGVVPGGSGGLFIAGTNAATTVTTSFTTTFTGNLTGSVASVSGAVGSVTGSVASVTGAVASVTGNVGGNVTGSVGSISGVTFPTNFSVLAIAATTGQVGIDWSNIKAPTTSVSLSGTTIATTQQVDINTIKTQAVTAAAGVTFPTSIASPTNITAGTIATVTNLTNAPTAGDFTSTMKTSLNAATPASVVGAVGSVTGNVGGNVTGSVGSVTGNVGGNVVGSTASVTAAVTLSAADSPVVATGTATAGAASTITLQTALGADSLPNGMVIKVTSGTGAKQARVITGYVNSTKVVTVDRAWTTNPDSTSVYAITYGDAAKLDSSLQVTAGTVGDKTGYSLTQGFPTNFSSLSIDASGRIDLGKILGTASAGAVGYVGVDWGHVNAPTTSVNLSGTTIATTQQVDVQTIKTQGVTCAAAVTVNPNLGTTQPLNFTGTSTSALAKVDMVDIAGSAVSASTAQLGVNVVNFGGSAGTFASGVPSATLTNAALDAILSRDVSTAEGTMPELCLGSIILAALEWSISGTTWTVKRSDGVTTHLSRTLTATAGADPVTAVG